MAQPPFKKQPNGTFAPMNQIGPHLASSVNWKSWAPTDNSNVSRDISKFADMPASAQECGPIQVEANEPGLETVRYYEVAWSQAADFVQWCYGYSSVESTPVLNPDGTPAPGNPVDNSLHRVIPAQDPHFPYLYCDDCRLEEPKGVILPDPGLMMTNSDGKPIDYQGNIVPSGDTDQGVWPGSIYAEKTTVQNVDFLDGNARFRVRYRPRPYPVRNDDDTDKHALLERSRFVQVTRRYAIQALALAKIADGIQGGKGQLAFAAGPFSGSKVPEAGVLLMPTQTFVLTCHEWPYDIGENADPIAGMLNNNNFQLAPGWPSYKAGTLLCQAPEIHGPTRNAAGALVYRAELRLDYRSQGWNAFPAPDGNFYLATFGGQANGPTVYGQTDFEKLFTVQAAPNWS